MYNKNKFSVDKITKNLKKFLKHLKGEEKMFFIYLIVLSISILFVPFVKIINIETGNNHYFLLWNNIYLFKSFLIILMALIVLIWRSWSEKIRNVISLLFWFKDVPFLLNFWLLWIILTSYIGISEWIAITSSITTRVQTTFWFLLNIILILIWLFYSLYLTLQQSKKSRTLKDIYIQEHKSDQDDGMKWLFSKMKS